MVNDKLIKLAKRAHGDLYAALLRADIEIAKRKRCRVVPHAWHAKRRKLARQLDAARMEYRAELARCRGDFERND